MDMSVSVLTIILNVIRTNGGKDKVHKKKKGGNNSQLIENNRYVERERTRHCFVGSFDSG